MTSWWKSLRLGFHSRRPSKPASGNVEHDRGESSGAAALAGAELGIHGLNR